MPDHPYQSREFGSHFDAEIQLEDGPLPIKIKHFRRAEMEAFEQGWDKYIRPRGTVPRTPEEQKAFDDDTLAFFEKAITDAVTLDEGVLKNRNEWIVDGAGLIELFHARKDVLGALLTQVFIKNKLIDRVLLKNLSSPRGSAPDGPSTTATGSGPGSTAAPVDPSSTAKGGAAMGSPAPVADGEIPKVH